MSRRSDRTISVLVPPSLTPLSTEDPRTVGPYIVIGRIGKGRTGTVYAAVNPRVTTQALLAVKVLDSSYLTGTATRAELDERLRRLAAVDGRCDVPPVDYDAYATPPWLAMRHVPGTPLARYVRKRGALHHGMLIALAAALAEGLQALHNAEVSHGDLKPSNVLLSSSGPRILDCALPGDSTALRHSAAWLSPERHEGDPPSPPADIFAWGAVIAFAATGRLPFGHGEPEEIAARVATHEPDLAGVPDELRPLLQRALARRPERRPSVRELIGSVIAVWESSTAQQRDVRGTAVTRLLAREWHGIVEPAGIPRAIDIGRPRHPTGARKPLVAAGAAAVLALGGGAWAGVAALGDSTDDEEPGRGGTASPSAPSPEPTGPRSTIVRFGEMAQPNPVEGPWLYTPVERGGEPSGPTGTAPAPGSPSAQEAPMTPQEWSQRWTDTGEGGPHRARIAPDAVVNCAQFCLAPGQVHTDAQGRGTYEVTGRDFIDYLGWGDVVIAEVTFAETETAEEVPEIVEITELFYPED